MLLPSTLASQHSQRFEKATVLGPHAPPRNRDKHDQNVLWVVRAAFGRNLKIGPDLTNRKGGST